MDGNVLRAVQELLTQKTVPHELIQMQSQGWLAHSPEVLAETVFDTPHKEKSNQQIESTDEPATSLHCPSGARTFVVLLQSTVLTCLYGS